MSTIDQDGITLHVLCDTCQRVVGSSALLARHRPLWSKIDDEEIPHWSSGRQLRAAAERGCHLCNLILSSLLNERSRFSERDYEEGNIILRIWDGDESSRETDRIVGLRREQCRKVSIAILASLLLIVTILLGVIYHWFSHTAYVVIFGGIFTVAPLPMVIALSFWLHSRRPGSHRMTASHCYMGVSMAGFEGTGKLEVVRTVSGLRRRCGLKSLNDYSEEDQILPLETISTTYRSSHSGSEAVLQLVKNWIQTCSKDHPICKVTDPSFRAPTRLLDISEFKGTSSARLVLLEELSDTPEYLTLSYCWGGKSSLVLNSSNVEQLRAYILASEVPLTITHAMEVTLGLGYSFLWVDSLCIIQDSQEDMDNELISMAKIYRHSTCTIAATVAKDCTEGFLSPKNPLKYAPCRLSGTDLKGIFARGKSTLPTPDKVRKKQIDKGPLNQRGWVVQERLLSVRTVHFGLDGVVLLECNTREAYDSRPDGIVAHYSTLHVKTAVRMLLRQPRIERTNDIALGPLTTYWDARNMNTNGALGPTWGDFPLYWHILLEYYTKCQLTKPSDRLPAIAGVLSEIERAFGLCVYDGIWHLTFDSARELLWVVENPGVRPSYQTPTWSWASVNGVIRYDIGRRKNHEQEYLPLKIQAAILEFKVAVTRRESTGTDISCSPNSSYVRVSGRLVPVTADEVTNGLTFFGDEKYPCDGVQAAVANNRQYFCLLVVTQIVEARKTEPNEDEANCNAAGLVLISGEDQNTYRRIGCWQFGDRIKSFSYARYFESEVDDTHLQHNVDGSSHQNKSGAWRRPHMRACRSKEMGELVATMKRGQAIRRSSVERFYGCAEQVVTIY